MGLKTYVKKKVKQAQQQRKATQRRQKIFKEKERAAYDAAYHAESLRQSRKRGREAARTGKASGILGTLGKLGKNAEAMMDVGFDTPAKRKGKKKKKDQWSLF